VGVSLKILPSLVKKNYKRKDAKSNTSNKPAKVANLHYTPEQISQLKSQMGISSMAQSINTLTGLMQTLVNSNKDSLTQSDNNNNVQQPVMSQGSKTVQPSVTVTRQVPRHRGINTLAKPEEILPFFFSSVCNWEIYVKITIFT
jgi:hypothetical protein